jgi:hypothetical protein
MVGGARNSTGTRPWLNLKRGVAAPDSGSIEVNGQTIAEQIGAQVFIDGWAIAAPGNPALAAEPAEKAARVNSDGAAVDAAKLWAAMEAAAFVSRDVERLIDVGLAYISSVSPIAKLVADIRGWRKRCPDWREAREMIEARYGHDKYPGNCGLGHGSQCRQCRLPHGAMLGLEGIDAGRVWRSPYGPHVELVSRRQKYDQRRRAGSALDLSTWDEA